MKSGRSRFKKGPLISLGYRKGPVPPYTFLMSTLSKCSHLGHAKVLRSNPGLPGSMCARYICLVHFGHRGRSYMIGVLGVYLNCGMCNSS